MNKILVAVGMVLGASGCFMSNGEDIEPAVGLEPNERTWSAGYLTHEDGVVDPHCHGVLIDGRHVLTARGCVEDGATFLSFAIERTPDALMPVRRVIDRALDRDWVVLELDARVIDGAGAEMTRGMPVVGDLVEMTSFAAIERDGGLPEAQRWSAEVIEVTEDEFVAEWRSGMPGCHGDLGVAGFIDGAVAGVLVRSLTGGPAHPASPYCVTRYRFRHVAVAGE